MGCVKSTEASRISPENGNISDDNAAIVKDRKCTDGHFLVIMGGFVIVLIVLLVYCMMYGDIYRLINGYDDCGNICGRKNTKQDNLGCSGVDRINEPYLVVNPATASSNYGVFRMCVSSCEDRPSYQRFLNRCLPVQVQSSSSSTYSFFSKTGLHDFFEEVSEDLQACWKEILYLCIISLVFSILMIFAFRFLAPIIVWIILVGVVLALICGTVFIWIEYKKISDQAITDNMQKEKKSSYLVAAILVTIATVCICLVIFAMRKRISLVVQLFKEAGKAVSSMPFILFEPILTFLALTFFVGMWLYFALFVESSGHLEVEGNQSVQYVKDTVMMATRWYNLFALFWFANFVIGCQHMVVAGAVSIWFFTRNKSKVSMPILKSFTNLLRYHLGTVALGSFCLAIVNMLRVLAKALSYSLRNNDNRFVQFCSCACQCCLYAFEKFLQFLSRNAYIVTAISGDPFCEAGQKAFNLLSKNALRVFAINSVGDFILLLSKAFIVLCTILVGIELIQKKEGILHSWVPLVLAGLFAYLVAHCFISIYEMTIDTIFICFCEDCERNDGINKPYYMSRALMNFVQDSKKVLQIHDTKMGKAWSIDKNF